MLIASPMNETFASGIGLTDWKHGIETLIDGREEKINILKAGDRYSINILDAGLGADVVKMAETRLRWLTGQIKYNILSLMTIMKHKTYPVLISIDGGEVKKYDLNLLGMGFGQTFGSGLRILPEARYQNEEMEIGLIHSAGKSKLALNLLQKLATGRHVEVKENVIMLRGKSIELTLDTDHKKEMWMEAEGEIFTTINSNPQTIELIEEGLTVIVPKDWDMTQQSLKAKD